MSQTLRIICVQQFEIARLLSLNQLGKLNTSHKRYKFMIIKQCNSYMLQLNIASRSRREGKKIDVVLLINVQQQSPESDTFLSVATWIDNKKN